VFNYFFQKKKEQDLEFFSFLLKLIVTGVATCCYVLQPKRDFCDTASVTTSNKSDFTVMIVTVGLASGSLKAEPKECLTS